MSSNTVYKNMRKVRVNVKLLGRGSREGTQVVEENIWLPFPDASRPRVDMYFYYPLCKWEAKILKREKVPLGTRVVQRQCKNYRERMVGKTRKVSADTEECYIWEINKVNVPIYPREGTDQEDEIHLEVRDVPFYQYRALLQVYRMEPRDMEIGLRIPSRSRE